MYCESEKIGEQSSGEDDRLRAKRHLRKEGRIDNTDRGIARESASASAKRDSGLGVEATLTDRELH